MDASKLMTEIFHSISSDKPKIEIKSFCIENLLFFLREDKNLDHFSDAELLEMQINIVPLNRNHRFPFVFDNFNALLEALIKENKLKPIIPYDGVDKYR